MQQHLPPLSAFGWFIDARCGSPHRMPLEEKPATLAAMARSTAEDGREPTTRHRLWHRLARMLGLRQSNPMVISAIRPADTR
jgi:hypothetical protein